MPGYQDANLEVRDESGYLSVGKLMDKSTLRHRDSAKADRETLFPAIKRVDLKGVVADKDNQDLSANYNVVYSEEELVLYNTFKDIKSIIETAVIQLVKDLQLDKRIKDKSIQ